MPESFSLDRLPTPIGTALLVTDEDGMLRALDWEDHEPRMRQLLRLQYGAVELKDAQAPRKLCVALPAISRATSTVSPRSNGVSPARRSRKNLACAARDSSRHHAELRRARRKTRDAARCSRAGPPNGSNPISVVLPCHRLIGAGGSLVKYGGGLERKRWLLQHEGVEI